MKMRIFLVSAAFLLSLPVNGQVKRLSREAIDSIRNRKVLDTGSAVLKFESTTHDMGTMYESDSLRKAVFSFVNCSGEIVVITDITTNCGCTVSSCDKHELQPGESGQVTVAFNPKGRSGTVDTNAFVYTSLSSTMPVARLTLLGNVIDKDEWRHLPYSMGNLRLKRKSVAFEPVRPGTKPQMRIPCANVGTTPVRLFSRLLPDYVRFSTEPLEIAPGEEGDIVITVDGSLLHKNSNGRCRIVVEGVGGRISDHTIEVEFDKIKK